MNALAGAVVGALTAGGVWLVIAGATGVTGPSTATRPAIAWAELWWRAALVLAAVVVGWAITGWPAAGALAGAVAGVAPMLVGTRRRRQEQTARSEALAVWAEMLRDTIGAHAGLREA